MKPAQPANLAARLMTDGPRFDFFQAVRLMEWLAREQQAKPGADPASLRAVEPVGHDGAPGSEPVRFGTSATLRFTAAEIAEIRGLHPSSSAGGKSSSVGDPSYTGFDDSDSEAAPDLWADESAAAHAAVPRMIVNFFGLTGPMGVLPDHYTALLIERVRQKDEGFHHFLDIFSHRLISQFYRAWEKYRFPFAYERSQARLAGAARPVDDSEDPFARDAFTSALRCLVGLGTRYSTGRQAVEDEAILYYGSHFAHSPRTADALEWMLCDFLGVDVQVLPFQGQWLNLRPENQARMTSPDSPAAEFTRLGGAFVLGARVWDVQSKFRIKLGPLNYEQFRRFAPHGQELERLCQMTRCYVGQEYDFDVQPVLSADQIPQSRLELGGPGGGRLGENVWLGGGKRTSDFDEARFDGGSVE